MKVILSIIFMFLSAQSFADLEGKALSCTFKNSDGRVFHNAYFFEKNSEVTYYRLEREKDRLKYKHQLTFKYEVDSDFITLTDKGGSYKLNRKTLMLELSKKDGLYEKCQVHSSIKRIKKYMKKIQKQEQEKYNKTLEGNKI